MSKEKSIAQQNKEEFNERVNNEFGGAEDWDAKQAEIAAQTGADRVHVQKDVLATQLSQEGYVYNVHIGRTRFTTKLRPEDVGLDPENEAHKDFIKQYLSLGRKLLLSAETLRKLDRIDQQIRRAVDEKYSVPTVAGPFVPFKNVELMKAEVEQLKDEYFAVRDEILDRYDEIKVETQASYRDFAVEVYRLINKNPYYFPTGEEVERFVQSAMSHFPSEKEVYSSFYVTLSVGVVETTEFLSNQEARLRLIREREKSYREELGLIERQLSEDSKVQAEHERLRLQNEREEAKVKLAKLQAEQKAVEEALALKRDEYMPRMEQVFADLAGAVHGIIYDAVDKVNSSLKVRGSLSGASTRSLKGLAEKVRPLMLEPDPEVEVWLKKINDIVETAPENRDPEEVREAVNTIRAEASKVILALGNVPRTIRGISMSEIEAATAEEYTPVKPRQARMFSGEVVPDIQEPMVRLPRTRIIAAEREVV